MRVLRRRKTYIILAVVAVTAGALGLSLVQSKVYEGTASLLLAPKRSESLFDNNNQQAGQAPSAVAATQIELIQSAPVADVGAAGQQVQGKISDLQRQIDAIPVAGNPPKAIDPALTDRRENLINQQSVFRQRLDQIQLEAGLNSGGAQVVTPAA